MRTDLINILEKFVSTENMTSINIFGEGHIHETYLVETQNHQPDFILQRINDNIFRDIPGMMHNIESVTRHLRQKLRDIPTHDPDRESLTLIYTLYGQSFFKDEDDHYWRMYAYIPGTVTYQVITDPALAFEAGKAIGFFQCVLTDLETPLAETIPDFHNIDFRIGQFRYAREKDPAGRVAVVPEDIQFAEQHFNRMKTYFQALGEKAVIRVTHNDTKLNNILFGQDHKALCMIDLDTVMPGYVHFDYGDALRTMANKAAEDEKDLTKVQFDKEVYDLFTEGYMQATGSFLTSAEKELLPFAPIYLTFIIGLRFLTDYLTGDVYFRVHHPEHNLERARTQFKLVKEMGKTLYFSF
jgi:Ser/Thr protein kinase RdoA (MazF antagonist)